MVDWSWPAVDIERFVRALSDPYPNAYTYFRGARLRLIALHVSRCNYRWDVVRTDDGVDHDASTYFGHAAGTSCPNRESGRSGPARVCGDARGITSGVPVSGSSMIWHFSP